MDLSGLDITNQTTSYSQIVENTNKYQTTAEKDYSTATDEELMGACKEFEAYFVEQMFKAMQKMVPESEFTSAGSKQLNEYYKDQLMSEYADTAANQNEGLGVAQMLYEQMKRNYDL